MWMDVLVLVAEFILHGVKQDPGCGGVKLVTGITVMLDISLELLSG